MARRFCCGLFLRAVTVVRHAVILAAGLGKFGARAWLRIIWRCWQDGTAFDPALHRGRQTTAA